MIDAEVIDKVCEIPLAIAACPTAAIKPAKIKKPDGTEAQAVAVNNDRCMFCGNCYTMCPAMPLADADGRRHRHHGRWQGLQPDQRS